MPKTLKTVGELIEYLKNFSPEAVVYYDTNPLTGGTFEYFVAHSENESPLNLNNPHTICFISHKGW